MATETGRTSGERLPYWIATQDPIKFRKLTHDLETDICIIGGGMAGLTTGYLLAKTGQKIAIIEDGAIGSGESGRTSAHLCNALDDRFYNIKWMHGDEGARIAAESHSEAISLIERIVKEEGIDCDFERLPGFLFNRPEGMLKELQDEMEASQLAGIQGLKLVDQIPVEGFKSGPALKFPQQGQFHPVRYMNGLANAIKKLGGEIYTDTHAQEFKGGKDVTHVETKDGRKITSKSLVFATNVPISDFITIHAKQEPFRSYVITGLIPKGSVYKALYWDNEDPYHYIRTQSHDDQHDVLIVGGEDHKVGMANDFVDRYHRLESWTRERFPQMQEVLYKWSGQVIEPCDYMAYIGINPGDYKNVYMCTGDSGNGLTHTTIAGMIISELILGQENEWSKLYKLDRKILRSIPEMLTHNIHVNMQFKDYFTGGEYSSVEDIPVDCGGVIRKGLKKYAIYKDDKGKIYQCSAVCRHMNAIVRWNDSEKTWDCPAHGARYNKFGQVINAPAKSDLERVSIFTEE